MQVQNRLSEIRRKRGISAAALAKQVGVRPQTIYAIEAGTYIPNTLASLCMASILEVTVEELFSLAVPQAAAPAVQTVELLSPDDLPPGDLPQEGQPMRLCKVGKRMVGVPSQALAATLPLADGVFVKAKGNSRTHPCAVVSPLSNEAEEFKRILVAGCDPAMSILARHLWRETDVELIPAACSSMQAVRWLKQEKVHIAGSHLRDRATGESNLPIVKKSFPKGGYKVVTFAAWEQGLVLSSGNPKRIRGVADLAREDVRIVNREYGAGSRFLLDELLKGQGISAPSVLGYDRIVHGHISAAWQVHTGHADCCIATRAAARLFHLDFVPLSTERYDLIIPERFVGLGPVQSLLDILNRSAFQRELIAVGDYDMSQAGKILV